MATSKAPWRKIEYSERSADFDIARHCEAPVVNRGRGNPPACFRYALRHTYPTLPGIERKRIKIRVVIVGVDILFALQQANDNICQGSKHYLKCDFEHVIRYNDRD